MKVSALIPSLLFLFGCLTIFISSCTKFDGQPNETQISSFGDDESHYHGRICMDCHAQSGPGEGWFTLAGSINGSPGNSTVELYRNPLGPSILRIEVDAERNFYTTENIHFGEDGLFVAIRSENGDMEWMEQEDNHPDVGANGEIFNGNCNTCHGVTTDFLEPVN